MDFLTKEYVREALRSVLGGDASLINYKCQQSVIPIGSNYCSDVSRLIVKYRSKDEKVKIAKMMMKVPMTSNLYGFLRDQGIYEKERRMYDGLIQDMCRVIGYDLAPLYYKTSHPEVILTEDLGVAGFRMADRLAQLDFDRSCQALKVLGKFHAASVATNENYPKEMETLNSEPFLKMESLDSLVKSFSDHTDGFTAVVKTVLQHDDELRGRENGMYRQMTAKQYWTRLIDMVRPRADRLNVLNHGDFWTSNILFHRETLEAKLIDFQSGRWCSPAIDITYFTVSSVQFGVYNERYEELLAVYLESLNEGLEFVNRPERYDLPSLKEDLEDCRFFAVFVLSTTMPVMLSDPDDPIDTKNAMVDDGLRLKVFEKAARNRFYMSTVRPWIRLLVNEGLI